MSVSEIWLAVTVTVQVVLYGSGEAGVSVNVLAGEALCANVCGAPPGTASANAPAVAVTLSLKLMTMVESTGTLVAAFAGVVPVTAGASSPGDAMRRHREIVDRQAVVASGVIGILPAQPDLLAGG